MRSSGMALLLAGLMLATTAHAQTKNYGPGVSDSEIKIGQSAPFSGRHRPSASIAASRMPTSSL